MTRSEEETNASSLLSRLSNISPASDPGVILSVLRSMKHSMIGHDQNKQLFIRLGVSRTLTEILGYREKNAGDLWSDARVEAGIVVGSLAYGTSPGDWKEERDMV